MWPFTTKKPRNAAFGTGWWFNPQNEQAVVIPGNTDHYSYLKKNVKQFLEPGETPKRNNILDRWVQIRNYSSGELVIHFPEPTAPGMFRKTQDWLIGKVEPRTVAIGKHSNTGAVVQKPYSDWLNADSLNQFIQSRRGVGALARRRARLAQQLLEIEDD